MSAQSLNNRFALPNTKLASAVNEFVKSESPAYLYNHCIRSFLFASELAETRNWTCDREVLFLGCVLHDLGLVQKYYGKTRFEVDGANAALKKLEDLGVDQKTKLIVWDAIALHTTFHIPMQKQPEISLVQAGSALDVMGLNMQAIAPEYLKEILLLYPRTNMKERILEDLVAYLKQNPAGGAGYWMDKIAHKHVNHRAQFDMEEALKAAPFHD